jgi:glycosyltransferase involved in cell wall biosynthesis
MKLLVVPQGEFYRGPAGLVTPGALLDETRALLPFFERITICARVVDAPGERGEVLDDPKMDLYALPPYRGYADFARKAAEYRERILAAASTADLTLVHLPGYVGLLASWACQSRGLPLFHWVMGDWGRVVVSRRRSGSGRVLARTVLRPIADRVMSVVTRRVPSFHCGAVLYHDELPPHYVRRSTTVRERELPATPGPRPRNDPPRLLFVGRLCPEKGLPHLLAAAALLRRRGRAVRVELAGAGELRSALERTATELGLAQSVVFHGYVARDGPLQSLYRSCDCLVLPSLEDLEPRVLVEAMAQGCPVVATAVGGVGTVVRDGDNGLLVAPRDPRALADAVERVLTEPGLADRLARNGWRHAREHTLERATRRMMEQLGRHFDLSAEARPA